MKSIYVYGAGGHGSVVADIAKACGFDEILYIDDGENEYKTFEDIKLNIDIPICLGIGSNSVRKNLVEKLLKHHFNIITLVHPSAIVSENTKLGIGTVVMPNVVVNTDSEIGKGVILNTGAVIEHDNIIKDFVHLSPRVTLAGNVIVQEASHIGIGSCVIEGIIIGKNCLIGAGSVVVKNIQDGTISYGNPCKKVKDKNE